MTSGVYELKFSSGDRYIGKSINIENRWVQHRESMLKGTAAKPLQRAFSRYGFPAGDIMLECHTDHIDIMEAVYIARHKPELNTDRPTDPFPGVDMDWYINNTDLLKYSTLEHMQTILDMNNSAKHYKTNLEGLKEEISELESLNDELLVLRSAEEVQKDISRTISSLNKLRLRNRDDITRLSQTITQLTEELAHANLPWWKKLFK